MGKIYITLALLFSLNSTIYGVELQVDKDQKNHVIFISDAPVEDFEGITDQIDGYVYWEKNDTLAANEIYFEVDLRTIDTGIGLRNRHMRDNYLETDKYPYAIFKGVIHELKQTSENEYNVQVKGTMKIHGVENDLNTRGKVIVNDDLFHIQTQFDLNIRDYNIKVPQLMFLKINEVIAMELDFFLKQMK